MNLSTLANRYIKPGWTNLLNRIICFTPTKSTFEYCFKLYVFDGRVVVDAYANAFII